MKRFISLFLVIGMIAGMAVLTNAETSPFSDVKESRWSYEYILFALERGLMDGVGGGKFDPAGTMTRAMVVTVLWRMEEKPEVTFENAFDDVPEGKYYSEAVIWAKNNDIVNGVSERVFNPGGKITREQLATMLFRYAEFKNYDTAAEGDLSSFPDGNTAHSYAVNALIWANSKEIITGVKSGDNVLLNPRGNATREQFATIIYRVCGLFEKRESLLKEDPVTEAVSKMEETLYCSDHGVFHAEFGAPDTLNEKTLSNLFVSALDLDISIYRALFREDEISSLVSEYSALSLGETLTRTVKVKFINDRLFYEDWHKVETEEKEIVLSLRRGLSSLAPGHLECPVPPVRDEETDDALYEIGSLLCSEHGVLHARGKSFSEDDVGAAVLALLGKDDAGYSVRIDGSSLETLSAGGEDPAELTFSIITKALEGIEGAKAESDPVTVKVSVLEGTGGFEFEDCPCHAQKAFDRFEEKYLCADHGTAHIALSSESDAELTALIKEALNLGDAYLVSAKAEDGGSRISVSAESTDGTDIETREYPVEIAEGGKSRFILCDCDKDAYQFIYHMLYYGWGSSGWSYDLTANAGLEAGVINDNATDDSSSLIRDINVTSKGKLSFRTGMTFTSGFDGAVIELKNRDGEPVMLLETKNGSWNIHADDGSLIPLYDKGGESYFRFEINVDMYEENSEIWINGKDCGEYALLEKGINANIASFILGSTVEGTVSYDPALSNAEANYSVYEQFAEDIPKGSVPSGWEVYNACCDTGDNVSPTATVNEWGGRLWDRRLRIGGAGYASKNSYSVKENFAAEFSILPDLSGTDFAVSFRNGGSDVLNISFDDETIYLNSKAVYEYVKNVPYNLRFDVCEESGNCIVKINGIERGEIPLSGDFSVNNVVFVNNSSSDVWIDDVYLYETYEHPDYVPEPVIPEGGDEYTVGINVCNLWYNGDHLGWDCITPHKDLKPVLGYYDEGSPEAADWEIKYMVEHGIDFQAVCFYSGQKNAPLTTRHGIHLARGFKNAKYSNMMKYCIMWESANGLYPVDMNAWKTYYVPYFIEHFFKDPRYLTINNKLVLSSFGGFMYDREDGYWNDERMAEAREYLDEEVRKLGFDGVIFIGDHGDGFFQYNLGRGSYDPENVKFTTEITYKRAQQRGESYVPTVGMGANVIGWEEGRTRLATVEEFRESNKWITDVWMKEHPAEKDWMENLLWVATWNEYGEGHYLMPAADLVGFGYLDVLRDLYTDGGIDPSVNTVPTEKQLKRIGHLYKQDRVFLFTDGFAEMDNGVDDPVLFYERNDDEHSLVAAAFDLEKDAFNLESGISITDRKIVNTSDKNARVCLRIPEAVSGMYYSRIVFNANLDDDLKFTMEYGNATDSGFKRTRISIDDVTKPWEMEYFIDIPIDKLGGDAVRITLPPNTYLKSADVRILPESGEAYPYFMMFKGKYQEPMASYEISPTGEILVPYCQKSYMQGQGIGMFDDFSVWDAEKGCLTLEWTGEKTMSFTVGSSFYYDEGVKKYLGYELYTVDGVPMIPIEIIAEKLGLTASYDNHGGLYVN